VLRVRLQAVQVAAQRLADDVAQILNEKPFTKAPDGPDRKE
jgi:hypothetical protein